MSHPSMTPLWFVPELFVPLSAGPEQRKHKTYISRSRTTRVPRMAGWTIKPDIVFVLGTRQNIFKWLTRFANCECITPVGWCSTAGVSWCTVINVAHKNQLHGKKKTKRTRKHYRPTYLQHINYSNNTDFISLCARVLFQLLFTHVYIIFIE